MTTWILVADESRARLFEADTRWAQPREINAYTNPDARVPAREHASDRPVRTQDSATGMRSAFEPRTQAREKIATSFAQLLAQRLEEGRIENAYDEVILAAAPRFLGVLRKALPAGVSQRVGRSIDKDITAADLATIREQITAG